MEDFGHAKQPWLRSFLELPGGIPSHGTFNRVFSALEPGRFLECFLRWTPPAPATPQRTSPPYAGWPSISSSATPPRGAAFAPNRKTPAGTTATSFTS